MRFRFAKFCALFFSVLALGFSLMAQKQHASGEQPILFSSPDGETAESVSNALLPAAQSPQPDTWANMPEEVPDTVALPQAPGLQLPRPPKMPFPKGNSENMSDENSLTRMTPSEMMGIPTVRDIFGLPKPETGYDGKKLSSQNINGMANATTNSGSADDSDSTWVKILSANSDGGVFGPDQAGSTHVSTGIFDSTPGSSVFGSEAKIPQDDSVFGPSVFGQSALEQSAWNSATQPAPVTAPADSSAFSPGGSSFGSGFSAGSSSQPAFAPASSGGMETLQQLPSLPGISSQNNAFNPSAAPSAWAPKPPPWLSSSPQLGTMPQRKF
jgi:hypothetical protein